MTVERMLTEEEPAADLVGRVLQEAGIEYRVRHLRRPHRPHRLGPAQVPELAPHGAGARGVARRRDGRGLWPADAAAWRDDRAGAVGAGQRPDRHDRGVPLQFADAAAHRFLAMRRAFHLHAPYQQATGDYGSWDARRAFSGVTKQVMQAHDAGRRGAGDAACDQACARRAAWSGGGAVRHGLAGRHGEAGLAAGAVSHALLSAAPAAAGRCGARGRRRAGAACRRATGGDRRQRRAHRAGLRRSCVALAEAAGLPVVDDRRRQGLLRRNPSVWRSGCSARSAPRRRTPASPRPIWCWRSARSSGRATPRGRTAICWTRRARPSSRSTSSRATHRGHSRPSTCCWATPRRSCGNCTRRFDRMRPDGARPARPGWPDGASRRAISTRRATSPTTSRSCRSGRSAS